MENVSAFRPMRGSRKPLSTVFDVKPAMNDEARMTNDEKMTKSE